VLKEKYKNLGEPGYLKDLEVEKENLAL